MNEFDNKRIAIVHYWLVGMRGGEKVLEELCDIFPRATIITHVADRASISSKILQHEIRETFIARLPGAKRHYQKYLPLMPYALEMMNMSEFDLIVSSESGPAKGIIPRPDALHVCYCHSPMRYIWDQFHLYRDNAGLATRIVMPFLAHKLRIWDVTTAARVDAFFANSTFVAQRINSYYRRHAEVIHPPVAVDEFTPAPQNEIGDHYLLAGELVGYKRADLAVEAFTGLGLPLRVVGDGEQMQMLKKIAGPNIQFLGRVDFQQLKHEMAHCKALIFPGQEDFGIVPVEAIASGRPVIAFGSGGALDTVLPGETGLLFYEQTIEAIQRAVLSFEATADSWSDGTKIRSHSLRFSQDNFRDRFRKELALAHMNKGHRN